MLKSLCGYIMRLYFNELTYNIISTHIGYIVGNIKIKVQLLDRGGTEVLSKEWQDFSTNDIDEELMITEGGRAGGGRCTDIFVRAVNNVATRDDNRIKIEVAVADDKPPPVIMLSMETKTIYNYLCKMGILTEIPGIYCCTEGMSSTSLVAGMDTIYHQLNEQGYKLTVLHFGDDGPGGFRVTMNLRYPSMNQMLLGVRGLPTKMLFPRHSLLQHIAGYKGNSSTKPLSKWDKTQLNSMIRSDKFGTDGKKLLKYVLESNWKCESEVLIELSNKMTHNHLLNCIGATVQAISEKKGDTTNIEGLLDLFN